MRRQVFFMIAAGLVLMTGLGCALLGTTPTSEPTAVLTPPAPRAVNPTAAPSPSPIVSPSLSPTATGVPPQVPTSTALPVTPVASLAPRCPGPPVITSFRASPNILTAGAASTLSWGPINEATGVVIDQGIGQVQASDSITVTPKTTTLYTLTATGCGGSATRQVTITVNPAYAIPVGVKAFQGSVNPANSNQVKVWVHAQTAGPVTRLEIFVSGAGSVVCNNTAACDDQLGYRDFGYSVSYWVRLTDASVTFETEHLSFTVTH